MKRTLIVALVLVALPLGSALAGEKTKPSHSAASGKPSHQILPPDTLVKNFLLPAWRAGFLKEVKSWHKKGAAVLGKVSVKEDEKDTPFADAACTTDSAEKERAAPPEQDRPLDSSDL